MQAFLDALSREFPADFSSKDPTELATYGKDWTKVFAPSPSLLVRPRSTDEVCRFLKLASAHGQPVVPSGGRTGLAGGAMACKGEIVLSMERMRTIHPVDPLALTVQVEAGAITEAVHAACGEHGLFWPVDFASKGDRKSVV